MIYRKLALLSATPSSSTAWSVDTLALLLLSNQVTESSDTTIQQNRKLEWMNE
jgi:hypothetical protein